jgi:AraC-like DNA-binding protein
VEPARDEASFLRAPVGRWMVAGCSLVWVHSPTLGGSICWGRQTAEETQAVMRLFDGFPQMAHGFDLILDGSLMDAVDPGTLAVFLDWTRKNLDEVVPRLRRYVGVVPPGMIGFVLAGIAPIVGKLWPFKVTQDLRSACRLLLPDGGDALHDELAQLVSQARHMPPVLARLRQLLIAHRGQLSVGRAAQALGRSPRSLQRALQDAGRSYREEQQEARFKVAEELLAGSEKIASVASRVGLGEAALTALVRARTGLTPGELRDRLRGVRTGSAGT